MKTLILLLLFSANSYAAQKAVPPNDFLEAVRLRLASEPVSMAVIVKANQIRDEKAKYKWSVFEKDFYEKYISTRFEEKLIQRLAFDSNFKLIERSSLDRVLSEQNLSLTGIMKEGTYKIGEILGINYLLLVNIFCRDSGRKGEENMCDEGTIKLVHVESGRIYWIEYKGNSNL